MRYWTVYGLGCGFALSIGIALAGGFTGFLDALFLSYALTGFGVLLGVIADGVKGVATVLTGGFGAIVAAIYGRKP